MLKTLEGVRVIDFGMAAAGPVVGKILREYGAEVIMVEPVNGTSTRWMDRSYDYWANGKKSVPVNIKTPEGREVVYRLVKSADVFLSNYREKALINNEMTYEKLKAVNPGIIYARMYGWGPRGPLKDSPAYDITAFWARGGYLRDIAEKGTICVGPQGVADASMGPTLASGICAALYRKLKTGEGCELDTSIYAQAIFLNVFQSINAQLGEEYPKSRKEPREALVNTYQCKDGKWIIMFDNQFDRHFWKILEAVGRPDLVGDPRWTNIEDTKLDKAPELTAILDEAFGKMTQEEAVQALSAIDVAVEPCNGVIDTVDDPQALENRYLFNWTLSSGLAEGKTVKMPASPVSFNGENCSTDFQRGPRLGEHTVEQLKLVGYSDAEIRDLIDRKIVAAEG